MTINDLSFPDDLEPGMKSVIKGDCFPWLTVAITHNSQDFTKVCHFLSPHPESVKSSVHAVTICKSGTHAYDNLCSCISRVLHSGHMRYASIVICI